MLLLKAVAGKRIIISKPQIVGTFFSRNCQRKKCVNLISNASLAGKNVDDNNDDVGDDDAYLVHALGS